MSMASIDTKLSTNQRLLGAGSAAFPGRRLKLLAANLALSGVYFACGKFGLSLAFVDASASAVWPPTGVALAALLLWGYRLWPGVFLGAFLVNITTQGSVPTCLGIAAGNACEALAGAWLVSRFAGGLNAFEKTNCFLSFVFWAGMVSTTISSVVGVSSLCLGGFAVWSRYGTIWLTWWLGDLVSDLIMAPFLLIWLTRGLPRWKPKQYLEPLGLLVAVFVVGVMIFGAKSTPGAGNPPLTYLALLPLLWAAFRFGKRGAVTAAFVMDGIALWGTLKGWGPFASADPNESLLFLQVFVGTAGLTAVALALAVSERRRTEQLSILQCTISRQLGEAASLGEALACVLESVCSTLRGSPWDVAAFWAVDANKGVLRCSRTWRAPPGDGLAEFEAVSRRVALAPGVSLPGRIWVEREPVWIPDLQRVETNCPRVAYARGAGLHGGCGFPVCGGKDCVGVIEVYTRQIRPVAPDLIRVFMAIGAQVGQFIDRKSTEDRLALVIQGSSDGIWDWDLTTDKVFYSSRWKSMLGYAEDEIANDFCAWEQLLHPADRERALASVQTYLAGQTPSYELEHRLRHKDGSYRWILSRGVALRDTSGKPIRMAGSHVDLTARKQTEEQLRHAYAELSENEIALKAALQKLQNANEELQSAQLQLIQAAKLESVGTLAAGVAHEVKNPLQTIIMGVDYLTNAPAGGDGNTAMVLGDMRDAVIRANTIIRELLQLSAAKDFEPKDTDFNSLVEGSLRLIHNEAIASQISVVCNLGPDLPTVSLDQGKVEQVFINLFLNALQAMSPGGLLSVTTRCLRFQTDLKISGPAYAQFQAGEPVVIAEVRDTGKGITEEHLPKIFDPFFTTKPTGLGTGLGLSVVKKIIDLHGGAIDVSNAPAGGVLVTLFFKAQSTEKLGRNCPGAVLKQY